ncbi:MAG: HAD-IA family hydrolase [Patescibacteria group bacterium]|mgnify:FL=1
MVEQAKLKDPLFGQVKERLQELGVEAILFDLDDTLIFTSEIFSRYMLEYASSVAEKMGVEVDEVMNGLRAINDEEYKKMGVNPKRWAAVVEKLAKQFDHGEIEILNNLDILMKIYSTEPRLRQGVRALLETFKESGIKIGLVTHANVEWTYFKLDSLGLWDYFDAVVIVDENDHKKSEDWRRGMDELKVEPIKCLVVGDSLGGDIRPGDELGARTVWMPSPWSVYREGVVPVRTVSIDEISELFTALERLR